MGEEIKPAVWCQDWVESERGWRTSPDGYTLHLTEEDRDKFVRGYNRTFNNKEEVPSIYTRAEGPPRLIKITLEQLEILRSQKDKPDVQFEWQRHGIWGGHHAFGPES